MRKDIKKILAMFILVIMIFTNNASVFADLIDNINPGEINKAEEIIEEDEAEELVNEEEEKDIEESEDEEAVADDDEEQEIVQEEEEEEEENKTEEETEESEDEEAVEEDDDDEEEEQEMEEEEEEEEVGPTFLSTVVDGVTIELTADEGVLSPGTSIQAEAFDASQAEKYAQVIQENTGDVLGQYKVFDIILVDEEGQEVQPNGTVTVNFSNLPFVDEDSQVEVYHMEPIEKNKSFLDFIKDLLNLKPSLTDLRKSFVARNIRGNIVDRKVLFDTNHFSIYAVGTPKRATYNFYVDEVLIDSQIVKNGEMLVEPQVPAEKDGKKFVGWYNEEEKLDFSNSITVSTDGLSYEVNAKYSDIFYVYFKYKDEVITTKEVIHPVTTTDANEVFLVITEAGKAFSHWSTTAGGYSL